MRKNPRSRILRGQPKEQHISTIPKSCHIYIYIYINIYIAVNPKRYIGINRYRNILFHGPNRYDLWYEIDSLVVAAVVLVVK